MLHPFLLSTCLVDLLVLCFVMLTSLWVLCDYAMCGQGEWEEGKLTDGKFFFRDDLEVPAGELHTWEYCDGDEDRRFHSEVKAGECLAGWLAGGLSSDSGCGVVVWDVVVDVLVLVWHCRCCSTVSSIGSSICCSCCFCDSILFYSILHSAQSTLMLLPMRARQGCLRGR